MSLPTRNLDDRTFQDIVDEAKKRIAASCPAWTDHNVSDPGITLVELFAWMTEMVIYRLNQVPEKNYIKFMELLGLKLREPEPARVQVSFYLSAPQQQSVTIPRRTEVATVRTETRSSIIFSTDDELEIRPPRLIGLVTREMPGATGGKASYREHNLQHLGVSGVDFNAFGAHPHLDDALYFGFDNDLSYHVLELEMICPTATGLGIDPANPPWQWEGWQRGEGDGNWQPAVMEVDDTGGMNQSGSIRLRLPRLDQREFRQRRGYWLRCRVVASQVRGTNYDLSPRISNVVPRSWGGSIWATHASVVPEEVLGRSDGSPGQIFYVEHIPLLRRTPGETVEVRAPGTEEWEPWVEVANFAESGPFDKHFVCDSVSGEVRLGPTLREPDGSAHSFGAIPPRGAQLRFSAYRYGGGVAGNVLSGMLTVLKSSIPYVDHVINHADATGGVDAETLELAKIRAPRLLSTSGRAVTASDYEMLAEAADSRVRRARCVQPEAGAVAAGPLAGQIYLLLVPKVNRPERRIGGEELRIDEALRASVARHVDDCRLLTVRINIREPEYIWTAVELIIAPGPNTDPERVRADVEQQLYRFLNPIVGGPSADGWPFGRDLYPSDIYACLQGVRGIEYIESLKLYIVRSNGDHDEVNGRVAVPLHGLIASAEHRVTTSQ